MLYVIQPYTILKQEIILRKEDIMKNFKKLLVLVCVLTVLCTLNVPVFAEGTTAILDNGADGIFLSDLEWKSWYMFESSSEDATPKYKPTRDIQENERLITIGGVVYQKGLRYHPNLPQEGETNGRADITYDISSQNRTKFYAVVGKDSVGSVAHNIQFQVLADGKVVYETPVLGPTEGHTIDVDITGCKLLTLRALDGGDGITDDSCAWGNVQIYTNKPAVAKVEATPVEDGIYLSDIDWNSWSMYESSSKDAAPKYKPTRDTEENGGPIVIGGVMYPKGLRTHPDQPKDEKQGFADITYDISSYNYTKFSAIVGKDSVGSVAHNVQFQVLADGNVVYETPVLGPKDAHKIVCDITGAKMLTLRVSDSGDGINDDSSAWGNAQIYLKGEAAAPSETTPDKSDDETTVQPPEKTANDQAAETLAESTGAPTAAIVAVILVIIAAGIIVAVVMKKKKGR